MKKRWFSLALVLAVCLGAAAPASAYNAVLPGGYVPVSYGRSCAAAIDADGSLWAAGQYGWNAERVFEASKLMDDVRSVSCGMYFAAAVKTDGSLWMWGDNENGQVGNGRGWDARDEQGYIMQTVPVKVMDDVDSVSCGVRHAAALKKDGSLWTWGWNDYGKGTLGINRSGNWEDREMGFTCQTVPAKIMDGVTAVSCGGNFTAIVKADGSLWMCGSNFYGELGIGTSSASGDYDRSSPVKVMDGVKAVCCGDSFTAAIKTDGSLWTWGRNQYGQLGNGCEGNEKGWRDEPYQTLPVKVLDGVKAVSCGDTGGAAVKDDGSLWIWGESGSLGLDTGAEKTAAVALGEQLVDVKLHAVPVKVLDGVVAAACGRKGAVSAVKADGSLVNLGHFYVPVPEGLTVLLPKDGESKPAQP